MADSTTPNLQLLQPEVGASRDTWGTKTNGNWDIVDTIMPIGMVADFAGPAAPSGWLLCDGRLISRTAYSDLFSAIGTAWGAGDGTTTFKLPSHAGRAAIGPGTVTDAVGHTTGFAFAQLTGQVGNYVAQANLPNISLTTNTTGAHNHGYFDPLAPVGTAPIGVTPGAYPIGGDDLTSTNGAHSHTVSLGGSAQLMSVLSPVIVMTKIIFAGRQAIAATALAATTPRRELSAPLRGSH